MLYGDRLTQVHDLWSLKLINLLPSDKRPEERVRKIPVSVAHVLEGFDAIVVLGYVVDVSLAVLWNLKFVAVPSDEDPPLYEHFREDLHVELGETINLSIIEVRSCCQTTPN